jgi:hypothetical protein
MTVEFVARGDNYLVSQELKIFQQENILITPKGIEEIQTFISPKNISTFNSEGTAVYYSENIIFKNFFSDVVDEYYLRLNLNQFSFWISSLFPTITEVKNSLLKLDDPNFDFPLLKREEESLVLLDLEVSPVNTIFSIYLKESIFIDPINRLCSYVEKQGFKSTSYLYFPPDRFETLKRISASMTFEVMGANSYLIEYPFFYLSEKKYVGGCLDSKYCVTTSTTNMDVGNETVRMVIDG